MYIARDTSLLGLHPQDKNKRQRMAHANHLVPTTMEAVTKVDSATHYSHQLRPSSITERLVIDQFVCVA